MYISLEWPISFLERSTTFKESLLFNYLAQYFFAQNTYDSVEWAKSYKLLSVTIRHFRNYFTTFETFLPRLSFQVYRSLDKRNILILRRLMNNCNSANFCINSLIVASIIFSLIKKPKLVIVTLFESMVNKSIIQTREVSLVFKWIHFI